MKIIALSLSLGLAFYAGGVVDAWMAGALWPVRGPECEVLNRNAGRIVGEFESYNGRCAIERWRRWHPFGV